MGKWVISKVTEWGGSIQNACYTGEKAGIRVFIYEMMNPSETKQISNEKQNSKMGESVVRFMYGTPVLELEAWFDNKNWQWWQINKRYKPSMKLFHENCMNESKCVGSSTFKWFQGISATCLPCTQRRWSQQQGSLWKIWMRPGSWSFI